MSVQINIDKASLRRVNKSFNELGKVDWFEAVIETLVKIKSLAQLRLSDKGHIVTSRLRNSIYVQTKDQTKADLIANREGVENTRQYRWNTVGNQKGGSDSAKLTTIRLRDKEGAVGTNVVYGGKIERLDSFLYWASRNTGKDVGEYFRKLAKRNAKNWKK